MLIDLAAGHDGGQLNVRKLVAVLFLKDGPLLGERKLKNSLAQILLPVLQKLIELVESHKRGFYDAGVHAHMSEGLWKFGQDAGGGSVSRTSTKSALLVQLYFCVIIQGFKHMPPKLKPPYASGSRAQGDINL